ncbi:MAG: hypothetical protein RR620_11585 [Clostridium sp.]
MKIISLNITKVKIEKLNTVLDNIANGDADIIVVNGINDNSYSKINLDLKERKYTYYDNEGMNSPLIVSKAMFAIVNNEINTLPNCCEIYLPGLDASILSLSIAEESYKNSLQKEIKDYKKCMINNELLIIDDFIEEGDYKVYDYPTIISYAS